MDQNDQLGSQRVALTYDNIFDVLVERFSEFSSSLQEHVEFYDEMLPHVLMGDFTRYLMELCCGPMASEAKGTAKCREAISILESAINSSDPKLQELIAVSFVENLDPTRESYACMRSRLSPALRTQLNEYEAVRRK